MDALSEHKLSELCLQWCGERFQNSEALPFSGSSRRYYRLFLSGHKTVMGVIHLDIIENRAFISFSRHFGSLGLAVPEILQVYPDETAYLLTDLGDTTLLAYVHSFGPGASPGPGTDIGTGTSSGSGTGLGTDLGTGLGTSSGSDSDSGVHREVCNMYQRVLAELLRFQTKAPVGMDFSLCSPRASFDEQSMMWDLNYFKYFFLKLAGIPFNEQKLEDDFHTLCRFLLRANTGYFMYRDFQSRNIMISDGRPFFIDYQGGRKGPLAYDVASLLFEAKADLSPAFREELLAFYLGLLEQQGIMMPDDFMTHYYGYVYIRTMQAMGAYGYRGLYERKPLFLQSIPLAVKNIGWLRANIQLPVDVPELCRVWDRIAELPVPFAGTLIRDTPDSSLLTVSVISFSYKSGIPYDLSGNGGGFVFDCRAVDNPGRNPGFRNLTGRDEEVRIFLGDNKAMVAFLEHAGALVDAAVVHYLQRGFSHLQVCFGCTGGQHRSVYAADMLARHLKAAHPVRIRLEHREQGIREQL